MMVGFQVLSQNSLMQKSAILGKKTFVGYPENLTIIPLILLENIGRVLSWI